jgi:hypothetical protein
MPTATFQIPASAVIEAGTPIAIRDLVGFGASPASANVISINHETGEFTTGANTRFYARMVPNVEFAPTAEHLHARLPGTHFHTGMVGRSTGYTVTAPFVMVGDVGYVSNRVFVDLIGGEQSFFTAGMNPKNHRSDVIVRGQHADGDLVTVRVPEWRERNATWGDNAFGPQVTYFGWWTVDTAPPIYAYITKGDGAEQRVMINTPTTGVHVQNTQAYLPLSLLAEAFGYVLIPHEDGGYVIEAYAVPMPELTFDIFNNGEGGSPSRPNASLNQAGFIRMWTQLDGVGAPLPYGDVSITAVFPDGTSAMQFVRVNRAWVEGQGWQDHFSSIDILKGNGDWEIINFSITVFNQTVNLVLVNNRFVG